MMCGERDQGSEHESGPPDRRESGGWLFVFVLVEVTLQVCKPDPEPLMTSRTFTAGNYTFTSEDLPPRGGIRWAIGDPDGRRSSTWRLWGDKKGDVYLSMRSMGGVLKASFHRDRRCSVGFTSEYHSTAKKRFGAESRHWQRWVLPAAEVVRVAQVVFPEGELAAFSADEASQMRWISSPAPGNAIIVSVFIAEPPDKFNWPGHEIGGNFIGIMSAPTRFTWAVYSEQPLDPATLKFIEDARAKVRLQLPTDLTITHDSPGFRVALWGHGATPSDMFFVELNAATIGGQQIPRAQPE